MARPTPILGRTASAAPVRRFSEAEAEESPAAAPPAAGATLPSDRDWRSKLPNLPEGYDPHEPPPCPAWNLKCSSWRAVDRDNTLVSNWHNPSDPEDYSRITVTKSSFNDFDKMSFSRMGDQVKTKMHHQHKEDPEAWSVAKLAAAYGVSQPRVQAILLLKEWEAQDRALGRVTTEDDELEILAHEAHMRSVQALEEQENVRIRTDKFEESSGRAKGGPLGKFRSLQDGDSLPEKPDPDHHVKVAEDKYAKRLAQDAEQDALHKRVPNKRWTYVIKDTTGRDVR